MKRREFVRLSVAGGILGTTIAYGHYLPLPSDDPQSDDPVFDGAEILSRIESAAVSGAWRNGPYAATIGSVGMALRGIPYTAGTLEGDREVCRVSLEGLDCVTFFESSLAISRILHRNTGELNGSRLIEEITAMRYREGVVDGYTSRLHYFVDWVAENQRSGIVEDITATLPHAEVDGRTIDFMSTHRSAYPALKSDDDNLEVIAGIEKELNRHQRHWVPKRYVGKAAEELRTGDIVGITTTIKGLDVSHTGLCFRDDEGRLRLLHASLTKKKVLLDIDLDTYLATNKKQTGIIVARPVAPVPVG